MRRTNFARLATPLLAIGLPCSSWAHADPLPSIPIITEPIEGERTGQGFVTIDVTGIPSMDRARSPNNIVLYVWVGPFNVVNGAGWDVILQTVAPGSRLSDMTIGITNSAFQLPGVGIAPAALDDFPGGPTPYSRAVQDFPGNLPTIQALFDGLIRLEFFDGFDESPGAPDAFWVSGTLTLQTQFPIPNPVSPGTVGLFTLPTLVWARRRR